MLNIVWAVFFAIAAFATLWQWIVLQQADIFSVIISEVFSSCKLSVDIAIGLIGLLCFWLGLMKVADASGITEKLARGLSPLFARLMPDVPTGHPAIGSVAMNVAANMLGLDNAATPMGLRAMRELQTLNPSPETITRAQTLFMVLNTAAITIFPVTVIMYRTQAGSADPSSIFLPILLASVIGTLAGLGAVIFSLRLPVWDRVVALYVCSGAFIIGLLLLPLYWLPHDQITHYSSAVGNGTLLLSIIFIVLYAACKRIAVFDVFIDGAKEGFQLAISLIPYLVAMLVVIGLLRASGALPLLLDVIRQIAAWCGLNTQFVDALPTGIMKIFSGSGARAMMIDTFHTKGVDSFAGFASSIMQGSSETTFYVLTVYGGSVGLKRFGVALPCALLADVVGMIAAVLIAYWFYA
jgi:spore maturation protein SpmA